MPANMTDRYEKIHQALAAENAGLRKEPHPAITHCEGCGCDWVDNGLNPIGCPYCKHRAALLAERDALVAEVERLRKALTEIVSWFPSADTYLRLGFDPSAPMEALKEAKAALSKENSNEA